jgi:hypothetical protein
MTRRLLALVVPVLVAVGCGESSNAGHGRPTELHGDRLSGATGLRLLVSANPPYLLDVDTGRATPVTGLGVRRRGTVIWVRAAGRDAVVSVDRVVASGPPRVDVYVVRHGATAARRIASGSDVQPARGGRSVWLKRFGAAHRCALREVGLAGRRLRERPVSCSASLSDPGAGAVLVQGRAVSDPATGEPILRAGHLWAIAGHRALTFGRPLQPLGLTDLRDGTRRNVRWPSRIGGAQSGPDEAAAGTKQIAVSFADPAYELTAVQVMDVWLLDPGTGRWQQLPAMPADVALKFTSMAWTGDGRLVMVARTPSNDAAAHDVVAVWRPGQKRLAIRSVHLPARDSGSDAFVAWTR